jgi:hypothetical protein
MLNKLTGRVKSKSGLTIVDQDDPDDCDDQGDSRDTVRYESFEGHGAPSEVTVHVQKKSRKTSKKSKKGELEESLM